MPKETDIINAQNSDTYILLNGRIYDKHLHAFAINNILIQKGKIAGVGYLPDDENYPTIDLERGYIFQNITDGLVGNPFDSSRSARAQDIPIFRGVSGLQNVAISDSGFDIPFPHQIISPKDLNSTSFNTHLSYMVFPLTSIDDVEAFFKAKETCPSLLLGGIDIQTNMSTTSIKTYIDHPDIFWILGCSNTYPLSQAIKDWQSKDLGSMEDFCKHTIVNSQKLLNISPPGLGLLQTPNLIAYSQQFEHILTVHQGKVI